MGEEPEGAEAVVDRDDHGALGRQLGGVVVPGGVNGQAAAVDPHEHGPSLAQAVRERRGVHVQVEAILRRFAGRREPAIQSL